MLELWGIRSTLSLLCWPGVVVLDRVLFMGQIEVWHLNCVQTNDWYQIDLFKIELFDHLAVCKQMTDTKLTCLK